MNTASSMGSVRRPVKVFCWLGWYDPSTTHRPSATSAAVAEPRAGPGYLPPRSTQCGQGSRPGEPTQGDHDPQRRAAARSSASSHGAQVSRSSGVGLLPGGAHRTAAVIRTPVSRSPSSHDDDVGWLASPTRYSARVQPVTAAVAGEHPPGPVGAVRRRRQPDDDDRGVAGRRSPAPDGPSSRRRRTTVASRPRRARATRPDADTPGTQRRGSRARPGSLQRRQPRATPVASRAASTSGLNPRAASCRNSVGALPRDAPTPRRRRPRDARR